MHNMQNNMSMMKQYGRKYAIIICWPICPVCKSIYKWYARATYLAYCNMHNMNNILQYAICILSIFSHNFRHKFHFVLHINLRNLHFFSSYSAHVLTFHGRQAGAASVQRQLSQASRIIDSRPAARTTALALSWPSTLSASQASNHQWDRFELSPAGDYPQFQQLSARLIIQLSFAISFFAHISQACFVLEKEKNQKKLLKDAWTPFSIKGNSFAVFPSRFNRTVTQHQC